MSRDKDDLIATELLEHLRAAGYAVHHLKVGGVELTLTDVKLQAEAMADITLRREDTGDPVADLAKDYGYKPAGGRMGPHGQ